MTIDTANLEKLLRDTSAEMMSSTEALMRVHGPGKVMLAHTLTNVPKILRMLAEEEVSEGVRQLVASQMNMALTQWRIAARFDMEEILKIAQGIKEQAAMIENELNEAVAAAGGSTKKE